jgi:hypothetical protein
VPGFPIRTPWDHSSVDSSPRPIAASHVLHRLLVPRHPPYALSNLTTHIKQKTAPHPKRASATTTQMIKHRDHNKTQYLMLASTVQFSTNTKPAPTHHNPRPPTGHSIVIDTDPTNQPTHTRRLPQDPTGCPTSTTSRTNPRFPCTTRKQHPTHMRQPLPTQTSPVSPPTSTPPPRQTGTARAPDRRSAAGAP